jgi:hypothetical protein
MAVLATLEQPTGRLAQRQRHLGRHGMGVGLPTNAVGAEQPPFHAQNPRAGISMNRRPL